MSFTVFLGNLPTWVTADDIKSWLHAETLVADSVKVIRNPETQESKGFAFIEAPNAEEMNSIIRRFDRAPLEDKLLRANPAQPPKGKVVGQTGGRPAAGMSSPDRGRRVPSSSGPVAAGTASNASTGAPTGAPSSRPVMANGKRRGRDGANTPQSAFAEELAKAL